MAFRCKHCKFRSEESKNFRECPYCGKTDGIEREKDASGLLDEINGLLDGEGN